MHTAPQTERREMILNEMNEMRTIVLFKRKAAAAAAVATELNDNRLFLFENRRKSATVIALYRSQCQIAWHRVYYVDVSVYNILIAMPVVTNLAANITAHHIN